MRSLKTVATLAGLASLAMSYGQGEFADTKGTHVVTIGLRYYAQPSGLPNLDYLPVLLFNPAVQRDLKLSPQVVQQEQSIIISMGMQMLPMIQKGGAPTPDARQKMIRAYEDLENKAVAPLSPAQRVRLHQLTLQFYGPTALEFPAIAKKVGLTPAQKAKLDLIVSTSGRGMLGHMPNAKNGNMNSQFGAMSKSMDQARAATERQVDKILTPAQKARWAALQGRKLPGITRFGGMGLGGL